MDSGLSPIKSISTITDPEPEVNVIEIVFFTVVSAVLLILLCMTRSGNDESEEIRKSRIATEVGSKKIGELYESETPKSSPSSHNSNSKYWEVPGALRNRSYDSRNGLDELPPPGVNESSPVGSRFRSRSSASDFMSRWTNNSTSSTNSSPRPAKKPLEMMADADEIIPLPSKLSARPSIYLPEEERRVGRDLHEIKYAVKKGRLFTLGGQRLMEKAPKVKLRLFTLSRYNMWYIDSYGVKKEFDIRNCEFETMEVRGTRGIADGHTFFAILMKAAGRSLLLGASTSAYRDEWVTALRKQQEVIREEEEELSGEEDVYGYKGLPSPAEQSLLLAPLHPRIKSVIEEAEGAVRNRLYAGEPELVDMFAGECTNMKARPNEPPILSPMHGVRETPHTFPDSSPHDRAAVANKGNTCPSPTSMRKLSKERKNHNTIFSSFEFFGDDAKSEEIDDGAWPDSP